MHATELRTARRGGAAAAPVASPSVEVPFSSGPIDLRRYLASPAELAAFRRFWRSENERTFAYYDDPSNRGSDWKRLTSEEILAIIDYSLGPLPKPDRGAYPMNRALRSRERKDLDRLEIDIKVLASGLSKLTGFVGTSYRDSDLAGDTLRMYQPGAIVAEPAFMSTSLVRDESATNRTVWIVHGKGGGKYIQPIANREREVLYPPGTRFEVLSRKTIVTKNAELWQSPRYELIEMAEVPSGGASRAAQAGDDFSVRGAALGNTAASRIHAAWSAEPFDAKRFVGALGTLAPLTERWPKSLGLPEGDTARSHHQKVVGQYAKYFGRPPYLLALALGMHDAGKPDNTGDHHAATRPIFEEALKTLGIGPKIAAKWLALIDGDPIGEYVRGWTSLGATVRDLKARAARAGLAPDEFFGMITRFYQADAGAYTLDGGAPEEGLDRVFAMTPRKSFILDPERHRLRFNSELEPKYRRLEEAFAA